MLIVIMLLEYLKLRKYMVQ